MWHFKTSPTDCFLTQKNPFNHSGIYFNNIPLERKNTQKHLGLYLDAKLNFSEHINEKIKKAVKSISVIKKINIILPRSSLITIYKLFIRPHLDYGDAIYDQPSNNGLSEKIESIQYNSALAVTGAIRGTSRVKSREYLDLRLESLKDRRWLRQLCYLHKALSEKLPTFLYELIPPILNSHHHPGCYRVLYCRKDLFRNSFLPFSINEWNKLGSDIRNLNYYAMFRKRLWTFKRPYEKTFTIIMIHKDLNRLRLAFSHLRDHKFWHNFVDTVNPLCSSRTKSLWW